MFREYPKYLFTFQTNTWKTHRMLLFPHPQKDITLHNFQVTPCGPVSLTCLSATKGLTGSQGPWLGVSVYLWRSLRTGFRDIPFITRAPVEGEKWHWKATAMYIGIETHSKSVQTIPNVPNIISFGKKNADLLKTHAIRLFAVGRSVPSTTLAATVRAFNGTSKSNIGAWSLLLVFSFSDTFFPASSPLLNFHFEDLSLRPNQRKQPDENMHAIHWKNPAWGPKELTPNGAGCIHQLYGITP